VSALNDQRAWLLDLFADERDGLVLWFLAEDGKRLRLHQPFPVTFYAAGAPALLDEFERYLRAHYPPRPAPGLRLEHTTRRDLFAPSPLPVLAVEVLQPAAQPALFHAAAGCFPALTFYDADIPLSLRFGARAGTFALAYCRVTYAEDGRLHHLQVLDNPWELDPPAPPLRILVMEPDANPSHTRPRFLKLMWGSAVYQLPLDAERPLLVTLRSLLEACDPDLLLTTWGDTWLLPELQRLARKWRIPLPLNREPGRGLARKGEKTYFSYGQVIHRGQQVYLFGRWHIDRCNAMLWGDYGLEGVLELGRVTGLPVQTVARVSPGTGISSMQILTALRQGVLVPWHKQQAEEPRSALNLFYADQGGLVYQPLLGLHRDVAELDFISMYPSIMVHFNISPETVGPRRLAANTALIPELGLSIDRSHTGLVPKTLQPLLEKRIHLKHQAGALPAWDPRRKRYRVCASAHKWLLVTCFGYLGYKNARFGRIEAHQAVTAYGREALLRAKEAVEDLDGTVLHLYVDGLWVKKAGASQTADFQPMLDAVAGRTGLPVSLDGIYRWVAFLPSRVNQRVPVANRYFGVFQDGSLKFRGIEARRQDTPAFIARLQLDMLETLARAPDADHLWERLPDVLACLRCALDDLRLGRIPLLDCLVTQKLSRKLNEFRVPTPLARAVAQLQAVGKPVSPGERVRFLYLRGEPGVWAWDLPETPNPAALDRARYRVLLLRAAGTILQPLGISEETLTQWALSRAVAVGLPVGESLPPGRGVVNANVFSSQRASLP